MDDVVRDISFGIGRTSKTRIDHELFEDPAWSLQPLAELSRALPLNWERSAAVIICRHLRR